MYLHQCAWQYCSLEQAKKLKELGVLQGKSQCAFIKNKCQNEESYTLRYVSTPGSSYEGYEDSEKPNCLEGYSAFSLAELASLFFKDVMITVAGLGSSYGYGFSAKSLADLMIYCIENKYCESAETFNKRFLKELDLLLNPEKEDRINDFYFNFPEIEKCQYCGKAKGLKHDGRLNWHPTYCTCKPNSK